METQTNYFRSVEMQADYDEAIKERLDTLNKPCAGGHKVDGNIPTLQDNHLDQRLCDCGRMKFISEECGCTIKKFELHGHPNQ